MIDDGAEHCSEDLGTLCQQSQGHDIGIDVPAHVRNVLTPRRALDRRAPCSNAAAPASAGKLCDCGNTLSMPLPRFGAMLLLPRLPDEDAVLLADATLALRASRYVAG